MGHNEWQKDQEEALREQWSKRDRGEVACPACRGTGAAHRANIVLSGCFVCRSTGRIDAARVSALAATAVVLLDVMEGRGSKDAGWVLREIGYTQYTGSEIPNLRITGNAMRNALVARLEHDELSPEIEAWDAAVGSTGSLLGDNK